MLVVVAVVVGETPLEVAVVLVAAVKVKIETQLHLVFQDQG
jgi:hypothetical protein